MGITGIDAVAIIIGRLAKNSPPTSAKGTRWLGGISLTRAEFTLIEPPAITYSERPDQVVQREYASSSNVLTSMFYPRD